MQKEGDEWHCMQQDLGDLGDTLRSISYQAVGPKIASRRCEPREPSPKGLGWVNCWTFGPENGETFVPSIRTGLPSSVDDVFGKPLVVDRSVCCVAISLFPSLSSNQSVQ